MRGLAPSAPRAPLALAMVCSLAACASHGAAAARLVRIDGPRSLRIERDGVPLLEYRRGEPGSKPFVLHLCTPAGLDVLRDAPPDHEHHHGLMLAIGVDDVDHWGEMYADVPGSQRERSFQRSSPTGCGFAQGIEWVDPRDGAVQLNEQRSLDLTLEDGPGATLLTWRSALSLPPGVDSARLWGRPYFGLGLRFREALDGAGPFVHASGEAGRIVRGDERLTRSSWCAYVGEVDGRPVTVAGFDDPRNPRHPATWFSMAVPFAYLSATLDLAAEPLLLRAEEELELRYGVALWDGHAERETIEELYRRWVARE